MKVIRFRVHLLTGLILLATTVAGCSEKAPQPPPQTPVQQQQAADNYANYMKTHGHTGGQ